MKNSKAEAYQELMEIIKQQEDIIENQNITIAKLVNENAEQENMINVLLTQEFI